MEWIVLTIKFDAPIICVRRPVIDAPGPPMFDYWDNYTKSTYSFGENYFVYP